MTNLHNTYMYQTIYEKEEICPLQNSYAKGFEIVTKSALEAMLIEVPTTVVAFSFLACVGIVPVSALTASTLVFYPFAGHFSASVMRKTANYIDGDDENSSWLEIGVAGVAGAIKYVTKGGLSAIKIVAGAYNNIAYELKSMTSPIVEGTEELGKYLVTNFLAEKVLDWNKALDSWFIGLGIGRIVDRSVEDFYIPVSTYVMNSTIYKDIIGYLNTIGE